MNDNRSNCTWNFILALNYLNIKIALQSSLVINYLIFQSLYQEVNKAFNHWFPVVYSKCFTIHCALNATWKLCLPFNFLVCKYTGSFFNFSMDFTLGAGKCGTSPKHIEQSLYTRRPIRFQQYRCLVCLPAGCSLPIEHPPACLLTSKTNWNESKHLGLGLASSLSGRYATKYVCS